jgi:ABC-2 type transport system permease protein
MNHRGGLALIVATWSSWLQYRGFFFLLAFGWMIPPLIYLMVWSTAAGERAVAGLGRDDMITYYLVLILVNQLTYAQANWTVGDLIHDGRMNVLLLRPIPPLYDAIASEVAGKVVYLAFDLPVVTLLAVALRPEVRIAPQAVPPFALALVLAWVLRFFWGYWLALLAFWTTRSSALLAAQDALVFLLAGLVAPMALLPAWLRGAATLLPFRYMVGFPVEVLTGQVAGAAVAQGFALQAGWLLVALALSAAAWRAGLRHYTAVGG